jgi:hypothetical protein
MSSLQPFNSDTPKHSFSLFCDSQSDSEQLDIQVLLLRRWPTLLPQSPPTPSPGPTALPRLGLNLSHESLAVISPDFSFAAGPPALPSLRVHSTDRLTLKTSESATPGHVLAVPSGGTVTPSTGTQSRVNTVGTSAAFSPLAKSTQ